MCEEILSASLWTDDDLHEKANLEEVSLTYFNENAAKLQDMDHCKLPTQNILNLFTT